MKIGREEARRLIVPCKIAEVNETAGHLTRLYRDAKGVKAVFDKGSIYLPDARNVVNDDKDQPNEESRLLGNRFFTDSSSSILNIVPICYGNSGASSCYLGCGCRCSVDLGYVLPSQLGNPTKDMKEGDKVFFCHSKNQHYTGDSHVKPETETVVVSSGIGEWFKTAFSGLIFR